MLCKKPQSHLCRVTYQVKHGLINYKDTKPYRCLHWCLSWVYRIEIQSVMLVFSTGFCELLPSNRVSFETSFDSKQPKLELKLVSALSETKRLFRLFRFHNETESFDVSIEPKQTKDQPKQFDREHILQFLQKIYGFFRFFRFFSVFFSVFSFFSRFFRFVSKQFVSVFRLFRFYTATESFDWSETNTRPTQTV